MENTKKKSSGGGHKKKTRLCPICNQIKVFDVRSKSCSPECASLSLKTSYKENLITPAETHDQSGDNWLAELRGTRIRTLEQAIEFFHIDLKEWRVERFIANKWEVGTATKSGITVEPLFQIKLWLVRKVAVISARNEIEELKKLAREIKIQPPKIQRKSVPKSGYLLELSIPDVHMGRLARGDETGWDNYDLDISKKLFENALGVLSERTRSFKFEQICFVVGNDILNADNLAGTTTKGTPQANDSRYHKVFSTTRSLLVRGIESLRETAPVKVIVISGNHDTLGAWHLGDSLESYFHAYKDVEIDNSSAHRKYHQFGNVMLAFGHGDQGKKSDLPLLMATEQPKMFGDTKFREMHTGHTHTVSLIEQHGVRVRILPSLAAADNWSSENGFVGNIRSAEAYVWSKWAGLVQTSYYNVTEDFAKFGAAKSK